MLVFLLVIIAACFATLVRHSGPSVWRWFFAQNGSSECLSKTRFFGSQTCVLKRGRSTGNSLASRCSLLVVALLVTDLVTSFVMPAPAVAGTPNEAPASPMTTVDRNAPAASAAVGSPGSPVPVRLMNQAAITSPSYGQRSACTTHVHFVATNTGAGAAESAAGTTRVGRWMSQAEYSKMVNSGEVQVGTGGLKTDVLNPANPAGYAKQAPPGSVYVEFDVPSNALVPGGNTGWNQIPTGSTAVGKNAIKNGGVVSPGVSASNISKVGSKP